MIIRSFVFDGHENPVYALEPYHEGKFFSGGGDRIVSCINTQNVSDAYGIVNTNATVYSIKYIAETNLLLAGTMNGNIHVVDLVQKKETRLLSAHEAGVFDIKHSALYNLLISAGGDGTLCFWRLNDISLIKKIKICNEKVRVVAISPDGETIAVGCGDGMIRIFELNTLELIHSIAAHNLSVNALAFHPLTKTLISGGRDALLKLWDTTIWKNFESIPAHNYAIYSICFSTNGKIFFSASRDKSIKVWSADEYKFQQKLDSNSAGGHSYSVNKIIVIDNLLISCSDDKKVIGWSIE
jgi:WD repeat-containing protein 61